MNFTVAQLRMPLGSPSQFQPKTALHDKSGFRRMLKLHGSVDLVRMSDGTIRQATSWPPNPKAVDGKPIERELLIYPMREKESFRYPFQDTFWEFAEGLRENNPWVLAGFSSGGEPLMRIIENGARSGKHLVLISPNVARVRVEPLSDLKCVLAAIDMSVLALQRNSGRDLVRHSGLSPLEWQLRVLPPWCSARS